MHLPDWVPGEVVVSVEVVSTLKTVGRCLWRGGWRICILNDTIPDHVSFLNVVRLVARVGDKIFTRGGTGSGIRIGWRLDLPATSQSHVHSDKTRSPRYFKLNRDTREKIVEEEFKAMFLIQRSMRSNTILIPGSR